MTAVQATASLALAASLAIVACERRAPPPPPKKSADRFVQMAVPPATASNVRAAVLPADRLLTEQELSPSLRKLVDAAHAHRAVASLEAAGCDQALVMTGADYTRLVNLRYDSKTPAQIPDPRADVVWCQSRAPTPPDCAELAPIFARVARPKGRFTVFSGYQPPPDAPRCAGTHDRMGKYLQGEGPGYPSSR